MTGEGQEIDRVLEDFWKSKTSNEMKQHSRYLKSKLNGGAHVICSLHLRKVRLDCFKASDRLTQKIGNQTDLNISVYIREKLGNVTLDSDSRNTRTSGREHN